MDAGGDAGVLADAPLSTRSATRDAQPRLADAPPAVDRDGAATTRSIGGILDRYGSSSRARLMVGSPRTRTKAWRRAAAPPCRAACPCGRAAARGAAAIRVGLSVSAACHSICSASARPRPAPASRDGVTRRAGGRSRTLRLLLRGLRLGSLVEVAAEQSVLFELDPPAARITLNRPDKRNALSLEVMGEVTEALRSASARGRTFARSSSPAPAPCSPPGTTSARWSAATWPSTSGSSTAAR